MIEVGHLKKKYDILNSEGCILGLYTRENKLYFGSFLEDGAGTVFYTVTLAEIKDYLNSILVINDIYLSSESFLVKHTSRNEQKIYLKEEFLGKLEYGNSFYKDLPNSMKSDNFEREYKN